MYEVNSEYAGDFEGVEERGGRSSQEDGNERRELAKREKRMMIIEKYTDEESEEVEKLELVALAKQAGERNSVWGQRKREDSDELSGKLTDNDFHVDVYGGMGLEDDDL
jgi:hypothetical protein